jgi:hypothetical protein
VWLARGCDDADAYPRARSPSFRPLPRVETRGYINQPLAGLLLDAWGVLRSASALRVRGVADASGTADAGASRGNKSRAFEQDSSALTRGVCFARGKWSSCARTPEQKPYGRVGCVPDGTLSLFCPLPGVETPGYFILPLTRLLLDAWAFASER